jgi:general secretion pathway protein E
MSDPSLVEQDEPVAGGAGADFDHRFGEHLLAAGKLDAAGLTRAGRAAEAGGERLHLLLPKLGMLSEQEVAEALSTLLDLPLARARDYPDLPVHNESLSANFLKESKIVPLAESAASLTVAIADPLDDYAIGAMRLYAATPVALTGGVPAESAAALERLLGQGAGVGEIVEAVGAEAGQDVGDDIERLRDLASEAPVVRIVNRLIAKAVEQRASDIHIEPFEARLKVRYRIDGLLQEGETPPVELHAAIISRIKIMAGLNIAERRLPQDGRIKLAVRGREIDLRVATIPSLHGEAVALRVLDRDSVQLDFTPLGFQEDSLTAYRTALARPNGVILVTGPTGSGKTTTLYASLTELNTTDRKVLTVEDPIEYQLGGINQVQIKPQIGLTFASVLRAMLRHDPDVIMVGEIRDLETVEIAIQAALTGHLVLSTLHTNNAAGTLMRLLDMGAESYLLASTLNAIVAQRLVRKLCEQCREAYAPLPDMVAELGLAEDRAIRFWRPVGCEDCRGTGYRGRVSINEVLVMTDPIREDVLKRADAGTIQRTARHAGMRPMFQDGLDKVQAGVTTIEEVLRVTREAD